MRQSAILSVVFLVIGSSAGALAQDPVKLSPNLYTVVMENDQVRVLEFRVKPGDREPMHSHPAAVVYLFTDAKATVTMPNGKIHVVESKAGEIVWSEPVTHAWEHLGPGNGRVLIVELKNSALPRPAARMP